MQYAIIILLLMVVILAIRDYHHIKTLQTLDRLVKTMHQQNRDMYEIIKSLRQIRRSK
jgi:hypothetical protein